MANLNVFVSSTCYDLPSVRDELRSFILSMGYMPIMSDYNDVLYDPQSHTHTSCVKEVESSDMIVFIIGSRFGGLAIKDAYNKIDLDFFKDESIDIDKLKNERKISITQLEVLRGINSKIPTYTFIKSDVLHDHLLYEKNKDKDFINQINFPSLQKQEYASYIFEFINYMRKRKDNNSTFEFKTVNDIQETLRRQWAGYFQRLISERRNYYNVKNQFEYIGQQFEDLKTAILTMPSKDINDRIAARGVMKYRILFEFLFGINIPAEKLKSTKLKFKDLIEDSEIVSIYSRNELQHKDNNIAIRRFTRNETILLKKDDTYYVWRMEKIRLENLSDDWDEFLQLGNESKKVIIETLRENSNSRMYIRYYDENFYDMFIKNSTQIDLFINDDEEEIVY